MHAIEQPTQPNDTTDSYFNHFSSYLAAPVTQLTQYLPQPTETHPSPTPEKITFSAFQTILNKHLLLFGYQNGFQVWNITETEHFHELVSKRQPHMISLRLRLAEYHDQLVLLIVSPIPDQPQQHTLHVFSLQTLDYIHKIPFETEILDIQSNAQVVAIVRPEHTDLLTLDSFDNLNTLETRYQQLLDDERHSYRGTVALGSRWIAYSPRKFENMSPDRLSERVSPPPSFRAKTQFIDEIPSSSNSTVYDVLQGVTSSIYQLGKLGREKLRTGTSPSPNTDTRKKFTYDAPPGAVVVEDTITGQPVCQFVSFEGSELAMAQFDPSGLLLLVCSVDGQTIHIHRLFPQVRPKDGTNQRLLYKLIRGVTHASILDAAFSLDSRWVALTTARGTTHIYGLNPLGGSAIYDPECFQPESSQKLGDSQKLDRQSTTSLALSQFLEYRDRNTVVSLSALGRIRHLNRTKAGLREEEKLVDGVKAAFVPAIVCTFLDGWLYISAWGSLTQFSIRPKVLESDAKEPQIQLQTKGLRRWDMRRLPNWEEVLSLFNKDDEVPVDSNPQQSSPRCETHTHQIDAVPLWIHPRISFHTYKLPDANKTTPLSVLSFNSVQSKPVLIRRVGPVPLDRENWAANIDESATPGSSPLYQGQMAKHGPIIPHLDLAGKRMSRTIASSGCERSL